MPKISTVTFTGKSGTKYNFDAFSINTNWRDDVKAIYVVTRRYQSEDKKYYHESIYIGKTQDIKERFSNHHQQDCFDENNANCICIHQESNAINRSNIETDLIQGNATNCNET